MLKPDEIFVRGQARSFANCQINAESTSLMRLLPFAQPRPYFKTALVLDIRETPFKMSALESQVQVPLRTVSSL